MLHSTAKRVPINTDRDVNRHIFEDACKSVEEYAGAKRYLIDERLRALNKEWDVERMLEANAATAVLVFAFLGATVHIYWFALTAFVAAFLLLHALQGWCPPIPIIRRMGFRTEREIDYERNALKALRGDFKDLHEYPMSEASAYAKRALQAAIR